MKGKHTDVHNKFLYTIFTFPVDIYTKLKFYVAWVNLAEQC